MLRRRPQSVQLPPQDSPQNSAQATARALFNRYPPHAWSRISEGGALHLVIAGFAELGQAIALHFMHLAHYGTLRGRLTILDDDHASRAAEFRDAYPQAEQICDVVFADLRQPAIEAGMMVTSVYVCLESQAHAIQVATDLRESCARNRTSPPIFLHLDAFEASTDVRDWDGQTFPFSNADFDDVDGTGDELAEIIHNYYRDSIVSQGQDLDAAPAGRPWCTLDESFREASRHQADHMEAKLAIVGGRSVPEDSREFFTYSHLEVERLARIEHDRWAADRYLAGWVYGPTRDNARKIHPQLILYDELSKPMKDLDRYAIRLTPVLFARSARSITRDLEIGIAGPKVESFDEHRLTETIDQTLERITVRAPDRFPVLLTSLSSRGERLLAGIALDRYGVALRVLLPQPIGEILAGLDTDADRQAYLQMLARAEHRYMLGDAGALLDYMARIPEMLVVIGRTDEALDEVHGAIIERRKQISTDKQARGSEKIVRIDTTENTVDWSFEY